jgi:hypothetical protein
MFVSEEQTLTVSFAVAASRLARLAGAGWLREVSETVYQGGVEYLMRVGLASATPGLSRLVRLRFTEPIHQDGVMTIGLRWEATGVTGSLFPALDADIRISAAAGESVTVTLTGSYRPPFGPLGAELDRLLLRAVATATIRILLARIAATLEGAPAEALQVAAPWRPEPGPEPALG